MPYGNASPQTAISATVPASVGGMNTIEALTLMRSEECIFSFNILPGDGGQRVREGYREWANGWTGGPARTVITFEGNVTSEDRLFVANDAGIWDVSTEFDVTPTKVVTFGTTTGNAGICSFINFSNDGNARFLLVCDGANGYYRWTQATNTWVKYTEGTSAGQIENIDPALFNFMMVWKERIWFIERDTSRAWYLGVGVFEGAATAFNFGAQFKHGGALRALHNWTLDGGDGIDDQLVAISGAGDVVIYQGTNPAEAGSFGLVGSWYVGTIPAGNRIAVEVAGELYVLCIQGLLPLSAVLNGADVNDFNVHLTAKISPYIRSVLATAMDDFGWQIHINTKQSLLTISAPPREGFDRIGFAMYQGSRAWGMTRSLPAASTANWRKDIFFTDIVTNKIYRQAGYIDKVYIDADTDGQPEGITWDVLTAYQHLEQPAHFKRVQYIRPMFTAVGVPVFSVRAQYDFDVSLISGTPAFGGTGTALWNAGLWNAGVWSGGLEKADSPRGATGMGRHIAINTRGVSGEETTLVGYDVVYDVGGLM